MQKYDMYQLENYVIVENKKDSESFCFKERIYYAGFIRDAYLCAKDGEKAKNEKEAFLYVGLGTPGGWWADPFQNLQRNKEVSNEYIPNGFVDELKKHAYLNVGTPIAYLINETEVYRLDKDEVSQTAPEVVAEVYDGEAVVQWYYQVDFDNDTRMDIVAYNGFTETYFYRQMPDGQYSRTYQVNSLGKVTRFVQYEGKNYFMDLSIYRKVIVRNKIKGHSRG